MPLRLEIKKKLSARSERVKSVDFHPNEPWILAALYSGHVFIWNYVSQSMVKSIEVCDLPVRAARFLPQKQWVVCGSDDMQIRVYNYNTMERVRAFEAHTDYIRSLAVHPTLPLVLSSSDDMLIKLWDWEKGWECVQVFEGHTHYVMQVEFNPKDTNVFASASLDRTVKVWGLNSPAPHFSLEGHERGVNCVSYFRGGDRPYLVSGADDHTVRVWDYQTKSCVATLEGHTNNISSVCFHPQLPVILSGSEDGTVRIWHANTYRLENTLNYGMERVWTICCLKGSNKVALGYDDGTVMIQIGHEEPVASMERGGKVVWANNHEIVTANVKTASDTPDGDRLPLAAKELGACELYPQGLIHSPNGRLLCACGDGEYIIYTALSLKNKSFGSALEFVWADAAGVYATRESSSKVKIFKDFKEAQSFRPAFAAEGIFGGALLGVRSADFVDFYDWDSCRIIRRIDVVPRKVFWSESGELVILACDTSFYVLRYNKDLVSRFEEQGVEVSEQGIEGSFDLEQEVAEKIRGGSFVGDCFIYTNTAGRLNYYVGSEVQTLAHLSKPMYLLGYLTKENRVYLMDKSHNMYSYTLLLSTLIYQTAIVRRDFDAARKALTSIPQSELNKIARFLEAQDLKELALGVTLDPEHKFELAMSCKKLDLARTILLEQLGDGDAESKWKTLGDASLNPAEPSEFNLALAEESYVKAGDLGGLLLIYSSMADAGGLERLATTAEAAGRNNVAFLCYFLLHRMDRCISLLCSSDRIPEAAFLTRTYAPASIPRILGVWKDNLARVSVKAAEALADPDEYPELFPDLATAVQVEAFLQANEGDLLPSILYGDYAQNVSRNLVADMKEGRIEPVSEEMVRELQQQAQARSPLAAEESEESVAAPAPAPVAAAPVVAPTPAYVPAPVQAPAAAAASFVATPVSVPSPVPVAAAVPAAAAFTAASMAKPVTPAPTTPASATASVSPSPSPSPAGVFGSNPTVFPSGTTLQVNASSPASAVPSTGAGVSAHSTPASATNFTPMSSTTSSSAGPSPAFKATTTAASSFAARPTSATSPAPAAAAASPSASPSPAASPLYASPAASASPIKAASVPFASAVPVASAVAPKPAVVTPKPAVSPASTYVPAPVPVAAAPVAAAPAPAAASTLDLSGDEDDDLSSPLGAGAPVPSLDEINASLAEIDGGDDDFGDFE